MFADVVIIGGGNAGSATAYYLCRQGIRPLVLERKCMGAGGVS
ncbi:MAG: FAD-dependent oxidoreductase [Lawsonibacter sp.]|nr:FAD-dependent oxidoreductase [Lawsonibacter sp.]